VNNDSSCTPNLGNEILRDHTSPGPKKTINLYAQKSRFEKEYLPHLPNSAFPADPAGSGITSFAKRDPYWTGIPYVSGLVSTLTIS